MNDTTTQAPLSEPSRRAIPIYSEHSKEFFVDPEIMQPMSVHVGGHDVLTSALVFGKDFSLVGISQNEDLLSAGAVDHTDAICEVVKLHTIYVLVDKVVYAVSKQNVFEPSKPTPSTFSPTSGSLKLSLDFVANDISIPLRALLGHDVSTESMMVLNLHVTGQIDRETSMARLDVKPITWHTLWLGGSDLNRGEELRPLAREKMQQLVKAVGFQLYATRANSLSK